LESLSIDEGHRLPMLSIVGTEPQTKNNQLALQTIRDLRELESLREDWKSWQTTRDSDFDYFCGIVRSRGASCQPHVIVITRNAKRETFLVGLHDRRKLPFKLCSVTMCQPEVNVLEFVCGGVLGNTSQGNCAVLVQAVMRSLAEGDADVALWEKLDVHSALYSCALQLPGLAFRDHCRWHHDHWFANAPKSLDALYSTLGRSQRSKLSRKYKRVLNSFSGTIQVRMFRTIADMEQAIRDMEQIARNSVKRQLGFGFSDTPQTRERLLMEAALGWLRIYILYIKEKPVAFWEGTLYKRCLQADNTGFDAAWSAHSPGIILYLNILEQIRVEDVRTVDLGCGSGQLYHCFGDTKRPEASVWICAPKLRGLRLNLLHTLTQYSTILIHETSCLDRARRSIWKRRQVRALLLRAGEEERHPGNLPPNPQS
jgi:CelD/BcsL family acetyltransferase involved in cellulose biosynthesis